MTSLKGVAPGTLCGLLVFTAQANAACYDTGIAAFADSPRSIELCVHGICEDALLVRSCGNIHYTSQDYASDNNHWLFQVRFHQDGPTDDEFAILRNREEIPSSDAANITCDAEPETGDCAFIDKILRRD